MKTHFCTPMDGCDRKLRVQSDIAKALGISRQAVSRLIKNVDRTGIPLHSDKFGTYVICDEVKKWYLNDFDPGRGPNRGIRAKLTEAAE